MLTKPLKHLFDESEFIQRPNLPEREVTLVAVSGQAGETTAELNKLGISVILVPSDLNLPAPINSHADIQMLHAEDKTIFCYSEHLFTGETIKNSTSGR